MNEIETVCVPRIRVFGIVLDRQKDGNYTANVKRSTSTVVDSVKEVDWMAYTTEVPWDVRIGQDWLRMFPEAWEPVN